MILSLGCLQREEGLSFTVHIGCLLWPRVQNLPAVGSVGISTDNADRVASHGHLAEESTDTTCLYGRALNP